jgi:predicted DsbA family dithiol-disulfide isomerase
VEWVAFELHPETPPEGIPLSSRFPGLDQEGMIRQLNHSGAPYGIQFGNLHHLSNSKLALEAAEFARDNGVFHQFHDAVFKAYFVDGLDIGLRKTILDLAAMLGLPIDELGRALDTGKYRPTIVTNGQQAKKMGINAIPAFLFEDGKDRIIGAQSFETFRKKLIFFN